jgi:hypothetical protein
VFLAASALHPATAQLTTIVQAPLDERAELPNAVLFFYPKSSVLSGQAADIVAIAAQRVGSGTTVIIQATSDLEAGETTETAAERAMAVRSELIRDGVPASAIGIVHAGASRTGIESRRVIISVVSAVWNSPRVASVKAAGQQPN